MWKVATQYDDYDDTYMYERNTLNFLYLGYFFSNTESSDVLLLRYVHKCLEGEFLKSK